jgi:hypothetical protein
MLSVCNFWFSKFNESALAFDVSTLDPHPESRRLAANSKATNTNDAPCSDRFIRISLLKIKIKIRMKLDKGTLKVKKVEDELFRVTLDRNQSDIIKWYMDKITSASQLAFISVFE